MRISAVKWTQVFLRCIFQSLTLLLAFIAVFIKCIWTNVLNCWLRLNSKWLKEKSLENSLCKGWEGKGPWILCITAMIQTYILTSIAFFSESCKLLVICLFFSLVSSMHLPLQICIGGIEKITWQLGLPVWLHHQKKDSVQVHMQIFSHFNSQALCHWATFTSIAEALFDTWNEVLSS